MRCFLRGGAFEGCGRGVTWPPPETLNGPFPCAAAAVVMNGSLSVSGSTHLNDWRSASSFASVTEFLDDELFRFYSLHFVPSGTAPLNNLRFTRPSQLATGERTVEWRPYDNTGGADQSSDHMTDHVTRLTTKLASSAANGAISVGLNYFNGVLAFSSGVQRAIKMIFDQ